MEGNLLICHQPIPESGDDIDEVSSNTFRDVTGRAIFVCPDCQHLRLENWRKAKLSPRIYHRFF